MNNLKIDRRSRSNTGISLNANLKMLKNSKPILNL
jgi:hypothetical protein